MYYICYEAISLLISNVMCNIMTVNETYWKYTDGVSIEGKVSLPVSIKLFPFYNGNASLNQCATESWLINPRNNAISRAQCWSLFWQNGHSAVDSSWANERPPTLLHGHFVHEQGEQWLEKWLADSKEPVTLPIRLLSVFARFLSVEHPYGHKYIHTWNAFGGGWLIWPFLQTFLSPIF